MFPVGEAVVIFFAEDPDRIDSDNDVALAPLGGWVVERQADYEAPARGAVAGFAKYFERAQGLSLLPRGIYDFNRRRGGDRSR